MLSGILIEDAMLLILERLPLESLIRFKSVSKFWCQLIECPQFITKHYQTRAHISNDACLLIKVDFYHSHFSFVYNNSLSCKDVYRSRNCNNFSAPCYGLFCVPIDDHNVELWNPAIREYKTLPKSLMPNRESFKNFRCYYSEIVHGLNYDPITNECKVVRIWLFAHQLPPSRKVHMSKVEVWKSGNNSWRQIDAVPPIPLPEEDNPINLKGRCYWLAGYLEPRAIVSFNMVHEVFRETPLPNSLCVDSFDSYKRMRVATLNESLFVFSNPLQQNSECFEVWLMNGDEKGSWSKYMTVEMPPPRSIPIYFRHRYRNSERLMMFPLTFWNKEKLVFQDEFGRLVFLNTRSGEIIHSEIKLDVLHQIYVYNESLVSIDEWFQSQGLRFSILESPVSLL